MRENILASYSINVLEREKIVTRHANYKCGFNELLLSGRRQIPHNNFSSLFLIIFSIMYHCEIFFDLECVQGTCLDVFVLHKQSGTGSLRTNGRRSRFLQWHLRGNLNQNDLRRAPSYPPWNVCQCGDRAIYPAIHCNWLLTLRSKHWSPERNGLEGKCVCVCVCKTEAVTITNHPQ